MKSKSPTGHGLSAKRKAFALEYLKDHNATAAYRRAGYKGSDSVCAAEGARLLRNPKIAAFIAKHDAEREAALKLQAEDVLREHRNLAFSDIGEVCDLAGGKLTVREFASLKPEHRRLIQSVKMTSFKGKRTVEVKLHPKIEPLRALGEHFKLFDPPKAPSYPGEQLDAVLVFVPTFQRGPIEHGRPVGKVPAAT